MYDHVICSGLTGRADWAGCAVLTRGSAPAGCTDRACSSGPAGGADRARPLAVAGGAGPACPLAVAGGADRGCPLAVAGDADSAGGADRAQAGWGRGAGLAVSAYPGIHVSTSARKGASHSSWQSTPRPDASTRWMS